MLRLHVVRATGVDYYVHDLGSDGAASTPVAGESPGIWTGEGSAVLGLRGRVGPRQLTDVCGGRDPMGDRDLRAGRGPRSVAAVDLTFCAPKSVSVLHLLAHRELGSAAGAAHDAAVADAVGYLERAAVGVRRSRGGVTRPMAATGAVAAAFVHRTSRALDPHLHTHLVTANVAQGADGLWSSVDTRRIFLHRRALDAVYRSSLRHELTVRTGVAWERGPSGRWDVRGVDPVLLRVFSRRAASIDESSFQGPGGSSSPGRRRAAFHADRPGKDHGRTMEELASEWSRRAADLGLDPSGLVDVVGRVRDGAGPGRGGPGDGDLVTGLLRSAGTRTTVGERELTTVVADASPSGLPGHRVQRVVQQLTRSLVASGTDAAGGRHWAVADVVRGLDGIGGDVGPEDRAATMRGPRLATSDPGPHLGPHRGPVDTERGIDGGTAHGRNGPAPAGRER